jgi:hypothetical protein
VLGEPARDLAVHFVPAGYVGDEDDPGIGAAAKRAGIIGAELAAAVSGNGDGFGDHTLVRAGMELIPHNIPPMFGTPEYVPCKIYLIIA